MQDSEFAGERQLMTFWQLVTLLVLSTGIVALSIDMMLPALPAIARDLELENANNRQLVITAFLVGFGLAQMLVRDGAGGGDRLAPAVGGILCPGCHQSTAPGKFCGHCGTSLESSSAPSSAPTTFCTKCGSPLGPDAGFCGQCGTRR